jgi:hypothetical protein
MAGSQEALDRFERQTAWPMMALALAIIPLVVVPCAVPHFAVDRDMVSPPGPKVNGVGRRSYRRRDGRPVGGGKPRVRIAA